MPKLNELQDRPDGIVLPNQLIAIADPATGEMYRLPLSIVLGITNITQPDPAKQILRFWKGPDDYFDIDFTGASPGGGGGAASRFGIEDITTDVNRTVDLNGKQMLLDKAFSFEIRPGDFLAETGDAYSSIYATKFGTISLKCDTNNGPFSYIDVNANNGLMLYTEGGVGYSRLEATGDEGFVFVQVVTNPDINQFRFNKFILPNTATPNSPENPTVKTIAATRAEDNFPDDAAAAAAGIPVGAFYHTAGVVKMRLV